jgi:hypothetical protein
MNIKTFLLFLSASISSATSPFFQYDTNTIPSWPVTTFLLTQYNGSTTRNRLHIEYFYDNPYNTALTQTYTNIYTPGGLYPTQTTNKTPDPYGILTDLYNQFMNINKPGRFFYPYIKLTIPLNTSSLPNASWFIQGFKPEGIAHGIPVRYVTKPALVPFINGNLGLQMIFPLDPIETTWCSTEQTYACPPGSPWNSGIPYFYPKAVNFDMNDILFEALKSSSTYGSVFNINYEVYTKSGSKNYTIPHIPVSVQYNIYEKIPMYQLDEQYQPDGSVILPPLENGL